MPRDVGPFLVLGCVSDSAYKIKLLDSYGGVSSTFNIGDLVPIVTDENLAGDKFFSIRGEY